jgi:tripartite-type tricarboxylate transporter receptor subunit TctC
VVTRLNAEINKALGDADVRARFDKAAMEPVGGTAEQFAQLMRNDYAKYGRLVKELNIRVD